MAALPATETGKIGEETGTGDDSADHDRLSSCSSQGGGSRWKVFRRQQRREYDYRRRLSASGFFLSLRSLGARSALSRSLPLPLPLSLSSPLYFLSLPHTVTPVAPPVIVLRAMLPAKHLPTRTTALGAARAVPVVVGTIARATPARSLGSFGPEQRCFRFESGLDYHSRDAMTFFALATRS